MGMKRWAIIGFAIVGVVGVALWAYHKFVAPEGPKFGAPEKAK